ncbi:lipopolysaccharide biosynthesis protein [Enterococcus camelliae]|uniref:Lipopolysaccharide biosynthesis protein n=1 Tax=Enterococcus camelliae TaxID=453959 RepID=A0ABW5TJQ8_9ENTE
MRDGKISLLKKINLDSRFKTLGANTVIFGIGNLFSKLILFFLMPLYTKYLLPSQYGMADLLNNGVELVMPFVTLCLYESVFRFSIDKEKSTAELILSNSIRVLIKTLSITFVICFFAFLLLKNYSILLFLLMLVPYSFRQLFAQFSRGLGFSKEFAISGIINAFSLGIFNIILIAIFKSGVSGYIFSISIAHLLSASYLFFKLKLYEYIHFDHHDPRLIKSMLKYSLPMIPNSISWWLVNISTRYILVFFDGLSVAGIFSAISKLPSIINMLSAVFQQAWQVSASKEIDKSESTIFFSKVFEFYYVIIMLACSFIITCMPIISKVILKGDFFNFWFYVPLLLVSAVLNCLSVYFGSIYTAAMNNKMIMISTVTGACISIISSFLLIPFLGILGAIITSNISYIVIVLMRYFDTKKIIKLNINFKVFFLLLFSIYIQSIGYIFYKEAFFKWSAFISLVILVIYILTIPRFRSKLFGR